MIDRIGGRSNTYVSNVFMKKFYLSDRGASNEVSEKAAFGLSIKIYTTEHQFKRL